MFALIVCVCVCVFVCVCPQVVHLHPVEVLAFVCSKVLALGVCVAGAKQRKRALVSLKCLGLAVMLRAHRQRQLSRRVVKLFTLGYPSLCVCVCVRVCVSV